ncbi:MAG: hypothetical protein VYE40_11735 [Myxococcota bacterium]|nr:hypothetical protein [Myxococcota bacterium]
MRRESALVLTLLLFFTLTSDAVAQDMGIRPDSKEVDCSEVPFDQDELGSQEDRDLCRQTAEQWYTGQVMGARSNAKNGLYTSEEQFKDEVLFCYACSASSPTIRFEQQLNNAPPMIANGDLTLTATVISKNSKQEFSPTTVTDDLLIFQFQLDLETEPEESEVVELAVSHEEMQLTKGRILVVQRPQEPERAAPANACAQAPGRPAPQIPFLMLLPGLFMLMRSRRRKTSTARVFAALCVVGVLATPSLALAQDATKMSEDQIKSLNEANAALGVDDLEKAETSINAALEKGQRFDILLLTLGRVLQKQDRCQEAKKAFGEMNVAPHEPSFTKEDINRLKERYIEQMGELCSASLKIECLTEDTEVTLLGEPRECGSTVKLKQGGYQLIATRGSQTKAYDVSLEGGEEKTFTVALEDLPEETDTKVIAPVVIDPGDGLPYKRTIISGVVFTTLTAGALTGAIIARNQNSKKLAERADCCLEKNDEGQDVYKDGEKRRAEELKADADRFYTMGWGLGVATGVVAAAGIATTIGFFVSDRSKVRAREKMLEEQAKQPEVSFQVIPGRRSAAGMIEVRF